MIVFQREKGGLSSQSGLPRRGGLFHFPLFLFYSLLRLNNVSLNGDSTFCSSIQQLCMDEVQKDECKRRLAGMAFKQRARCAFKKKPTNRGARKFSAFLSKVHACFGRTTVQGWGGYWQESRRGSHLRRLPTARSSANSPPSSCIVRAMFLGFSYFK